MTKNEATTDKIRILAVDDEPHILELYERSLALRRPRSDSDDELDRLGDSLFGDSVQAEKTPVMELTTCSNAHDAVSIIRAGLETDTPFALVYLDVRMPPGPDGIWAAEQIRQLDTWIEIVIVTGFSDVKPDEIARRVPPAHKLLYILKPFNPLEIQHFAYSLCKKWKVERELDQLNRQLETKVADRTRELSEINEQLKRDITERIRARRELEKSENRYRMLFENAKDAILIVSAEDNDFGKIIAANQAAAAMHGYLRDEMIGMDLEMLDPEYRGENPEDRLTRILRGEWISGVIIHFRKDGTPFPVEASAGLMEFEQGRLVLAFYRDISERKAAEDQVRRNFAVQQVINRLLFLALENIEFRQLMFRCLEMVMSIPYFDFEKKGCIFLTEADGETLTMVAQKGFSEEEQKQCLEISFGECLCGKAAAEKEVVFKSSGSQTNLTKGEKTSVYGHYCVPILASGTCLGVLNLNLSKGHQHDPAEEEFLRSVSSTLAGIIIREKAETEKRKIESQLHHSQKMEALGTLARGIAHDFNNILTAIIGNVEIGMLTIEDRETALERMQRVKEASERAGDLVDQILTFSRDTEEGAKKVNISGIVGEVLHLLEASLPKKIQVIRKIEVEEDMVHANPTQIHQIIMNLCTNAWHAIGDNSGTITVRLASETVTRPGENELPMLPSGDYLKISVSDTGIGMMPSVTEKIFDPYFTTKSPDQGTGLGLAVVHGIVERLGGAVQVRSTPGDGTEFIVLLPLA